MTAAHAAATVQIPAASALAAFNRATCNNGLVYIPTSDGPEAATCTGCTACALRPVVRVPDAARASRIADVFAAGGDDEPF